MAKPFDNYRAALMSTGLTYDEALGVLGSGHERVMRYFRFRLRSEDELNALFDQHGIVSKIENLSATRNGADRVWPKP